MLALGVSVAGLTVAVSAPAGAAELPPSFIMSWGSSGSGDSQFSFPFGVAVDASGNVFVVDNGNRRIQKFDNAGNFVTAWGTSGTGDGQFFSPIGVAVDGSGNVFVADNFNRRIQKFDNAGHFLTGWGMSGSGDGQFVEPTGVAVDGSGNVFVADAGNYRIQKFDNVGHFVTKWGTVGSEDGNFNGARSVAVDGSGNVFVTDGQNERVQKFDNSGHFLSKWGAVGSGDGQFLYPWSVAVDGSGNVFVADDQNHRIQKFDNVGNFVTKWGAYGTADGQFNEPSGVAVDGSGNVFVADLYNHRIQKFGAAALDAIAPVVETPSFSVNPKGVGESTVVSATATDEASGSGVAGGEYFLGSDPGPGAGTPMALSGSTLSATVGPTLGAGVYSVGVRARDVAGNWSDASTAMLVVFDPSAGFATGGGWLVPGGRTSDAGDALPGLDGTSKANFGFVVKYANGASTVPGGNLEFHYNVARFHLRSSGMDWLVVTNSNMAKFQGLATIDGMSGLYRFRVEARDGDSGGGNQPDRFTITIWAPGADPNAASPVYKASGDVSGGQIVIHR